MDIISCSVALYQLTSDVIRLCLKCRKGLKEAPKEFNDLVDELRAFITTLNGFREVAESREIEDEDDDTTPSRASFATLNEVLSSREVLPRCQADLSAIKQKLEKWQAASGAKVVLAHVSWPFKKEDMLAHIQSLRRVEQTLNSAISLDHVKLTEAVQQSVSRIHEDDLKREVLDWLASPEPATNFEMHRRKRLDSTGTWLLEGPSFRCWKGLPNSFLWVRGMPGCGKSVLSTAIIDQMIRGSASSPSATVLYCYFDFQDTHKQDVAGLLRSLLRQLYAASPQVTKIFEERYEACKRGKEILTHGALTKMLQKAIPKFKNVFIVVDALDECTELDELLELLEIIHQWKLAPLHLVTTSRTYYNIEESLLSLVSHTVLVEDSSIRDDIGVYVDNKLNHARPFSQLGSELRESIRKTLISGAHGMFRWVECQFDNLRRCRTPNEYHSALSSLPKTLNETYERMLDAVKAEDRERALKVLSLLVCSLRPLRIIDIAEATALNPDGPPYLDLGNRLLNPLDVLSLCPGLLATATKEPGSDDQLASDTSINVGVYHYLRLAHFSVKEYLLSTRMTLHSSQLPWYAMDHLGTNDLVARLCIAYLQFQEEVYRDRTSYRGYISVNHYVHVPRGYPLYNYARHNWFRHTQSCDTDANFRCHALAGQLISDCVRWGLWKYEHLFHGDCHFDTGEAFGLDHELYHASQYGLFQASALLIATGAEPSTAWGPEGSALHVVCTRHDAPASRIQIIRLLLQQGADVNAHTYDATALRSAKMWPFSVFSPQKRYGALRKIAKLKFKSPLTIAMQERHLGYTDVLLRHGAETEARNMRMETALLHATRNQDVRCVRLLLDNKADIEARNESGGTSLFVAAEDGLDEIVKLLLTYGARVNTQDASSRTPLSVALDVWPYQPEITEALLRKGADCNLGEPVSMIRPILHDCRTTVELMIAGGGDIHRYDEGYGTPLHAAARSGKQTIVNILLRKGASVSPKCHHVLTVLEAAASNGNRLIMEKILNHGADVNEISASGQSALQIASSYGHKHAVKLLLDRGANPYITDNQLGTLFKRAMEHEDIVRLLLDHLANDKEPGVSGSAAGGARL